MILYKEIVTMPHKLSDAEVSDFIQKSIDAYVAAQSWFYEEQIKPYLPAIAQHILDEMKRRHIHVETDK